MTKKLWCVSLEKFKQMAKENGWTKEVPKDIAIISIINSKDVAEPGEKHVCKKADNVLNLTFDDCSPLTYKTEASAEEFEFEEGKFVKFFTPEMAKTCIDFFKKNKDKDIYVHCIAGMSRSQAFVRFALNNLHDHGWETNPNNPCLFPNGFVYQRLMEAYRDSHKE